MRLCLQTFLSSALFRSALSQKGTIYNGYVFGKYLGYLLDENTEIENVITNQMSNLKMAKLKISEQKTTKRENLVVKYDIELLKRVWLFLTEKTGVRRCTTV